QRKQQRRDVLSIDVRVGHRDDLVVPDLLGIELFAEPPADRRDERPDLLVLQHLIESGFLDVKDLPAKREDGLELAATARLRRTAGGWPFHDEKLRLRRVALLAVREFSREVETFQEALPSRELTGLSRGLARLRRKDRLPDADLGDLRRFQEELGEFLVHDGLDAPLDLRVSELHLGCSLELRLGDLETENRCQSLASVVALEALALLQVLIVLRVLDEGPPEPGFESGEM